MKKFSKIFSRRLGRSGHDDTNGAWEPGSLESAPDFHQLTSKRWRGNSSGGIVIGTNGDGLFGVDGLPGGGGYASLRRKTFGSGMGRILADGSAGANPSCERCEEIDFGALLDWRPGDARPWVSLAHCMRLQAAQNGVGEKPTDDDDDAKDQPCPWCVFFYAMINSVPEGDDEQEANRDERAMKGKFTPYLRIRMAFERLGGGEKHGLGKSVLFEVTTRNRSLPWGYIVKAEPQSQTEAENEDEDGPHENGNADVTGYYVGKKGDGSDVPAGIHGRLVPPLVDLELPKCWIGFCNENHTMGPCQATDKPPIPNLRLIDCEERRMVWARDLESSPEEEPRDDAKNDTENLEYATLSYVSGSVLNTEDAVSTRITEVDGRLPGVFPRLIEDAVTICNGLGYRYLWVDRYCMPGQDEAARASERLQQLEQMGQIFGRSAVTIIVAAGHGINDGIPGISTPREEQLSLKSETALFTTSLIRPDLEVASSKWPTRAWTYQEGLLSRRRLIFTPSQTYFQCQTLHCHESISLPLKHAPGLNLGRVFPLADESLQPSKFRSHIKSYLAKHILDERDRLDAIRGLLHAFSQRETLPVENFLGLPLFHPDDFSNAKVVSQTDRLAVALGWMPGRTIPSYSSSQDDLIGTQIIDPYILSDDSSTTFPSWTWLAWRLRHNTSDSQKFITTPKYSLNFNLVGETTTTPLIEDVCATPHLEISVGFSDDMVMSWEIDGDAIARKTDRIAFLRLATMCFDLTVKKEPVVVPPATEVRFIYTLDEAISETLGKPAKESIEAWVRRASSSASSPLTTPAAATTPPPVDTAAPTSDENTSPSVAAEEYHLIGIIISGRNWKPKLNQPQAGATPAAIAASNVTTSTAIICGRRGWDPEGQLVRLGALSITSEGLVEKPGDCVLRNVNSGSLERGDLKVQQREVDIY